MIAGVRWGFYVNARDAAGNVSQASRTVPVTPPFCSPDTTSPSVPAGLTGSAVGTAVTLNWSPGTDDVAVTGYDVLRDGAKVGALTGSAADPPDTTLTDVGHHNPQGLAFDSQGRLWEQEFGNNVMDETNPVVKGGNYGWPACEGTIGDACSTAGFVAPVQTYPVASASCSGIAIVRDVLYIACLRGTRLYRAKIDGDRLTDVQQYYVGTYGRLCTVEPTIDGNLWLTASTGGDKDSVPQNGNEKIFKITLGGD